MCVSTNFVKKLVERIRIFMSKKLFFKNSFFIFDFLKRYYIVFLHRV